MYSFLKLRFKLLCFDMSSLLLSSFVQNYQNNKHAGNSDTGTRVSLDEAALAENTIGHISSPNNIFLIMIRYKDFFYN